MIRKLFVLQVVLLVSIHSMAQYYKNQDAATAFASNMSEWQITKDIKVRGNIEKLCKGKKSARIGDRLANELASRNRIPKNETYVYEQFLDWIQKEINNNSLNVKYSNFTYLDPKKTSFSEDIKKDYEFYTCQVTVSGQFNFTGNDLFYVYNGKIAKIDAFEIESGSKKVKIDFSDIEDTYAGLSYEYTKYFPIGISYDYNITESRFIIGATVGLNLGKKTYPYKDKLNLNNILDYERKVSVIEPEAYLTVNSYYCWKYFAVGCGVGYTQFTEHKIKLSYDGLPQTSYTSSGNQVTYRSTDIQYTTKADDIYKFMLRPDIKGYIPVGDDLFVIQVNIGYDFIFGMKSFNGFHAGIGIRIDVEDIF